MSELYVSMDIEADGPIPAIFSMLSFGAAAFLPNGEMVGTFERNLETLEGAKTDHETMAWWLTQPEAWKACRKNLVHPKSAMWEFTRWCNGLGFKHKAKPTFVSYPAGFDFTFIYWYLMRFVESSVFSFSGIDIKTYAMALMREDYNHCIKRNMPREWRSKRRHTHVALDDALGQGELFINMLKANLKREENRANMIEAFDAIVNITSPPYKQETEGEWSIETIHKVAKQYSTR